VWKGINIFGMLLATLQTRDGGVPIVEQCWSEELLSEFMISLSLCLSFLRGTSCGWMHSFAALVQTSRVAA
jgi:hypothetical protein